MPIPLQPGLLKAQVLAVLQKAPEARAVGFHADFCWNGPEVFEVEGRRIRVFCAPSVLEAREALAAHGDQEGELLVLLTPLQGADLGQEAMARLLRGRLLPIEPWEAVKVRMKAREVDPLLQARPDLARILIDVEPAGGFPAAPAGVVTADHVWSLLFEHALGLGPRIPDTRDLLGRSFREGLARWAGAEAPLREAALEYLGRVRGEAALLVLHCAQAGHAGKALPLGLACAALFARDGLDVGRARTELSAAAARLEQYVGGHPVPPGSGRDWAEAARAALDDLQPEERGRALSLGDEALEVLLRASEWARLSRVSPRGFGQRLGEVAHLLREALDSGEASDRLTQAVRFALEHDEARRQPRRAEALRMALRLLRWLGERPSQAPDGPDGPDGLAGLAACYAAQGAWADRARHFLAAGDGHPDLQSSYVALLRRLREVREEENRAFARALAGWTEAGAAGAGVLPIERLLDEVVVPLARSHRVLLVVLDGASRAVACELYEDLLARGWVRRRPADRPLAPVLATVPSVTEVSRASLLSGRLVRGQSDLEKADFKQHPGLRSVSPADRPPLLHHKPDLLEGSASALKEEVAARIAGDRYRVLGVVINAVDDFLGKDDQLEPGWDLDTVRPLSALLDHARDAGRVVVLASDHGHVLEWEGTIRSAQDGGERWRTPATPPGPGEVLIRGPRVLGRDASEVVVPYSEAFRYSPRKCGYHGGATPQEMLPPLMVLAPAAMAVTGWVQEGSGAPAWWDPFAPPLDLEEAGLEVPAPAPLPPPGQQLALFSEAQPREERWPSWLRELARSEAFQAQRLAVGAQAPDQATLARLLLVLRQSGGEASLSTLQAHLDLAPDRLLEVLDGAALVMNPAGHPVLTRLPDSARLDFPTLQRCFGSLGVGLELEVAGGARRRLEVPGDLSPLETEVLQVLARHSRLTELDLVNLTGRRRVGGVVENLSLRLEKAGHPWIVCEGSGDEGRVYAFRGQTARDGV